MRMLALAGPGIGTCRTFFRFSIVECGCRLRQRHRRCVGYKAYDKALSVKTKGAGFARLLIKISGEGNGGPTERAAKCHSRWFGDNPLGKNRGSMKGTPGCGPTPKLCTAGLVVRPCQPSLVTHVRTRHASAV